MITVIYYCPKPNNPPRIGAREVESPFPQFIVAKETFECKACREHHYYDECESQRIST